MKDENDVELHVRSFFECQGFDVDRLSASNSEKRADFIVRHGSESYVVEVKARPGNPEYLRNLEEQGFSISVENLGRTNVVSGIVRNAQRQLMQTASENRAFRILVLVPQGDDLDTQLTQIKHTLYGIVEILVPTEGETAEAIPCFYFTHSDFARFQSLDAALVLLPGASVLYVNSMAHRSDEFRMSRLHDLHAEHGAVIDPPVQEEQGRGFIADSDMDRSTEARTVSCIKRKYRLRHATASTPIKVRVGAFPSETA